MAFDSSQAYSVVSQATGQTLFLQGGVYYRPYSPFDTVNGLSPFGLVRGTPEFLHAALRGVIPGVTRMVFSGVNTDVDTGPEDAWGGDGIIPRPSSAESWEIVGGAPDAAAGTGARTVSITTLDSNFDAVTQTVTMNGITAVPLTGTHLRINSALVLTVGSGGKPSQPLEIRVAGAGATRAFVGTEGVLNQSKVTVPDSFTLEMHSALVSVRTQTGSEGSVFAFVTANAAGRELATVRMPTFSAGQNMYRHEVTGGLVPFVRVTSRTDFSIRALAVTAVNSQIDVSALGLLYDNSLWS